MILLTACVSIDQDFPKNRSTAIVDGSDTSLGRFVAPALVGKPETESGFYPVISGMDALALRLILANRAERSIDVQYYLIKDDMTGLALVDALLNAADRGVRVRLLVDDVFTSGYDAGLSALYEHPNFEVRIINPFNRGMFGRVFSGVTNFSLINRRMHNKSFTVDNQISIIGGRNIADEYFGAREDNNFSDLDVMTIGPIVKEISTMFDIYWNHQQALPIPAFIRPPNDIDGAMDRLRSRLSDNLKAIENSEYAEAVVSRIDDYFSTGLSIFEWAEYDLVYDTPDKMISEEAAGDDTIVPVLAQHLQDAESRVIVISPYFVPLDTGIEFLKELQARGVDVTVITNSLAANNQSSVHSGYAPSRKPLLENGIVLYEVKPDAEVDGAELFTGSGAQATLHTKAFMVDGQEVFIGSFNFDPRSAHINSEMGVLIRSANLARQFEEQIGVRRSRNVYEVFLDEDGDIRWRDRSTGGDGTVYDKEPMTSWWQRFKVGFIGLFPIDRQL